MVEVTPFGKALVFLEDLGIYRVVLPFLLIFTIIFAVLEKTRIFGVDTIEGIEYSKKNINSIIAFVIAFVVIASSEIVFAINASLAKIILLLMLSFSFLLLIGVFYENDEEVALEGRWKLLFMLIMFVGVVLIFLHSIPTARGSNWLYAIFAYIYSVWSDAASAAVVFIIIAVIFMLIVLYGGNKPKVASKEEH
ncbi:hypothetical protein ACFL0W_02940 [Nanoarchaeota archaeon]